MRVERGQLDPGAMIPPLPGGWHPRMPERLDEEEPADWRAGRDAGSRAALAASQEDSILRVAIGGSIPNVV
jgi:hypothetical protein